ncbi:pyridoxamine 5'-phosphate oxidase family protein, partial [Acidimicrobiales bacterium]|nr:pyridoxamine 5'-phosphate oxidase family protein [Acidimicrobiales bacterium]
MSDTEFYTPQQRSLQDQFDSRPLADRLQMAIVVEELDEQHTDFITSRDYFYLATVNAHGEPTVSYKGGGVGVVSVVDSTT